MFVGLHAGPLTAHFAPAVARDHASRGEPAPTAAQVRDRILAWREHLSDGLCRAGHLTRPLQWTEDGPGDVIQVDVDDLRSLKLLLAYADGKGAAPPELPAHPELDRHWIALASAHFEDSPYPHLLAAELWLPGGFSFTFRCPLPDGHEVEAGSVGSLSSECLALSEQLFGGTPIDWMLWAREPAGAALRLRARRAVAALGHAAARAGALDGPLLTIPL
ncbi:MAG: hypothetical protein IPM29_13545 [Planctomycetes bacterium]|nr:hypothetical protein [Planctomycetota bacterium]